MAKKSTNNKNFTAQSIKVSLGGITKDATRGWRARVTLNGKRTHVGYFKTRKLAQAALELARSNPSAYLATGNN
jgi:hypothetical protein